MPLKVTSRLFAKNSSLWIDLEFVGKKLVKRQRRLQDRWVFEPVLSVGDYTCRAVVDWCDLKLNTCKPTQAKWIKAAVDGATGLNVYAESASDTLTSTWFRVRIQQPSFSDLVQIEHLVEARWGLTGKARVDGLEVSVDFTPVDPSDEALARMFGVLARTHMPARDVLSSHKDRPRGTWGSKSIETKHVFPFVNNKPEVADELMMTTDRDCPVPIDATLYIGHAEASSRWRLMTKRRDNQNPASGTFRLLPDSEHRVRLEVTIDLYELNEIGIFTLGDLRRFPFQKFQGRYFKFRLPSFPEIDSVADHQRAVAIYWQSQRIEKFLKTGVLGVSAMDDAFSRQRHLRRKEMKRSLPSGISLRPKRRPGEGTSSSTVVYEEITSRVRMALRHLSNRLKS